MVALLSAVIKSAPSQYILKCLDVSNDDLRATNNKKAELVELVQTHSATQEQLTTEICSKIENAGTMREISAVLEVTIANQRISQEQIQTRKYMPRPPRPHKNDSGRVIDEQMKIIGKET